MKFKDLLPGDRFIFKQNMEMGDEEFHVKMKLRHAVLLLDLVKANMNCDKPFTAIVEKDGFPVRVLDETEVLKLN